MGLFHEVKCGKCDRRYSSIRSRCPYCGARKNQGKRASESDGGNRQVQQIVGIVVLLIIIIAVVVLVASSLKKSGSDPAVSPSPSMSGSGGVNSVDGTATPDPINSADPEPTPTPTPTPQVTVNSISLNRSDFTLSSIGEQWTLTANVSPAGSGATLTWTSTDSSVATVDENGTVTAVNKGTATVTASVGDVKAECIVRVTASAPSGGGTTSGSTSSGMSLSHSDVTISAASRESFKLSVSGATESPSYSSSDTGVATVDGSGNVTAVSSGTATVYVTVGSTRLSCIVRVR